MLLTLPDNIMKSYVKWLRESVEEWDVPYPIHQDTWGPFIENEKPKKTRQRRKSATEKEGKANEKSEEKSEVGNGSGSEKPSGTPPECIPDWADWKTMRVSRDTKRVIRAMAEKRSVNIGSACQNPTGEEMAELIWKTTSNKTCLCKFVKDTQGYGVIPLPTQSSNKRTLAEFIVGIIMFIQQTLPAGKTMWVFYQIDESDLPALAHKMRAGVAVSPEVPDKFEPGQYPALEMSSQVNPGGDDGEDDVNNEEDADGDAEDAEEDAAGEDDA